MAEQVQLMELRERWENLVEYELVDQDTERKTENEWALKGEMVPVESKEAGFDMKARILDYTHRSKIQTADAEEAEKTAEKLGLGMTIVQVTLLGGDMSQEGSTFQVHSAGETSSAVADGEKTGTMRDWIRGRHSSGNWERPAENLVEDEEIRALVPKGSTQEIVDQNRPRER